MEELERVESPQFWILGLFVAVSASVYDYLTGQFEWRRELTMLFICIGISLVFGFIYRGAKSRAKKTNDETMDSEIH